MDSIKIEKEINELIDKIKESEYRQNQTHAMNDQCEYELITKLNNDSKDRLLKGHTIEDIAEAVTNYIFSVDKTKTDAGENLWNQKKQLYQNEIKRVLTLFNAMKEEKWMFLELLYAFYTI